MPCPQQSFVWIVVVSLLILQNVESRVATPCAAEQERLVSCVVDVASSISPEMNMEAIPLLCSESRKMLECVRGARETCPTMDLLADESFEHAVSVAQTEYDKYCEDAMSKDAPANCDVSPWSSMPECQTNTSKEDTTSDGSSCNYNPVEALGQCNIYMAGVPPGDIEAMCGMGDVFLDCLTQIVQDCPQHDDLLAFDLEAGIITTRYMLYTQCPRVKTNCDEEVERAKQQCAYATVSHGVGTYCRSLEEYTTCIGDVQHKCPNVILTEDYITTNYQFYCGPSMSVTGSCPDDLTTQVLKCIEEHPILDFGDGDYCSLSKDLLTCIDVLVGRCQGDSRLTEIGILYAMDSVRQERMKVCTGNGGTQR